MRSLALIIPVLLALQSCSSFGVTKEIDNSSSFKKLKNVGIMLRLSAKSKVAREDVAQNLSSWLNGYKPIKKIGLIPNVPVSLSEFATSDRVFYQLSDDDEYQKYKTNGIIKQYITDNSEKLQELFKNEGIDLLVIYEIDSNYSAELKYTKLNTLVLVLNSKLEVSYLTYKTDDETLNSVDFIDFKSNTLDRISDRLIRELLSLNFIEKF